MQALLSYLQEHTTDILSDIETLVRLETPSRNAAAIGRLQDVTSDWFRALGNVERVPNAAGDLVHVHIPGAGNGRLLLLAHVDTVYPLGSWQEMWRIDGERAYGPGSYDMKAGIVQALWALRALGQLQRRPEMAIDLLLTPDEEVGSEGARPMIEQLAGEATAVLVLEAPFMNGDLKVARKGVGHYTIEVHGRAAHQGLEPENGRNAIVSAAYLIQQIIALQDTEAGTTLGPNVIQGGTVSNVVADQATIKVDLRTWTRAEADRVERLIHQLQPLEGTTYDVRGGLNRAPMEPTGASMQLFRKAQSLARQLGFEVGASRVGGASDGNLTASLAPTLDGFGAMGANAHQRDLEYIHIPSLPLRTALLAGMLVEP